MLWTLGGLCLFFGLGIITGGSWAFATGCVDTCKGWFIAVGCASATGALYLIMQWAGPAGGG